MSLSYGDVADWVHRELDKVGEKDHRYISGEREREWFTRWLTLLENFELKKKESKQ